MSSKSDVIREVSPGQLQVGDAVLIDDFLPSDEGYIHVVADVKDLGRGMVRVWFDVFEADGSRRATALAGREFYRWDRVYDLVPMKGHVPYVEVVGGGDVARCSS